MLTDDWKDEEKESTVLIILFPSRLQFLVNYGLTNKSAESVVTHGIETKANQFLTT
jgi:hypothetical protein